MNFSLNTLRNLVKIPLLKIGASIFISALCFALSLNGSEPLKNVLTSTDDPLNLSARPHLNSKNFDIFSDLLVWTAREAGADCWAEVITSNASTSLNELHQVHFEWNPGFRVGIVYKMKRDEWNTQAYYTRFNTKGKDCISSSPGTVHSTFLGNFYIDNASGAGLSGPAYQKASIDWTIHFNMFDWDLGRNFWISKSLVLRPFLGIKGGWINQFIHSKWQNPNLTGAKFYNIGTENLKNNFWGIGPEAGINTKWNLFCNQTQFYLFGDIFGALMWGHWSFYDVFQNDLEQQVFIDLQKINSGSSMLRTFMGFGWDAPFSQNRYRFSTKLGYEMQFWLDQLQFYSFTGGRLVNTLTLQGGTLEFCIDF
jgi:hypothetical protein